MIRKHPPRQPGAVSAVVSESDVLVLTAAGPAAEDMLGFLEERGVCGKQLHSVSFGGTEDNLTLVLSRENLHGEEALRADLKAAFVNGVQLIDGLGAVSAIGAGINSRYKNLLAGSACLRAAGIKASGVATSSFRITWLVERTLLAEAVRTLHAYYLEDASPPRVP